MVFTTLTSKGQVTVPKAVPDAWGFNCGALSSWELNTQSLRIGVMAPLDVSHLSGLETGLSEWSSDAGKAAFASC